MMKRSDIIAAAKKAHREFWKPTSDKGTGDRQARGRIFDLYGTT